MQNHIQHTFSSFTNWQKAVPLQHTISHAIIISGTSGNILNYNFLLMFWCQVPDKPMLPVRRVFSFWYCAAYPLTASSPFQSKRLNEILSLHSSGELCRKRKKCFLGRSLNVPTHRPQGVRLSITGWSSTRGHTALWPWGQSWLLQAVSMSSGESCPLPEVAEGSWISGFSEDVLCWTNN